MLPGDAKDACSWATFAGLACVGTVAVVLCDKEADEKKNKMAA